MLKKYVFLTSSSYSGSTLLAFILGSHSKIISIGEATGLNLDIDPAEYMCSCGQYYLSCKFWGKIENEIKKRISAKFSLEKLETKFIPFGREIIDRLQFKDLRFEIFEQIRDFLYMCSKKHKTYIDYKVKSCVNLAKAAGKITGKDIFFDTSKTPNAIMHLNRKLECEFKVIFLIRDGRGVLNSFLKKKTKLSEAEITSNWLKINKRIERKLKYIPKENVCTVLYKDLCKEPEKTLKRIFNFIDVKYENSCLEYWEFDHHIIGNSMRLNPNRVIKCDESWKNDLSTEQIKNFNKMAGHYNEKWGYY